MYPRYLIPILAVLGGVACSGQQIRTTDREPELRGRCGPSVRQMEVAPNPDRATAATTAYLSCLVTWPQEAPANLEARVADALGRNPYPQTRRATRTVVARFFDSSLLKVLPTSRREVQPYLELLDAQRLRAEAEGNPKLAQAIEKRKAKLQTLSEVIASMDDREAR